MDTQQTDSAETAATEALTAVIGGSPQGARTIIATASFRDLALMRAWADELARFVRQEQYDHAEREWDTWRDKQTTDEI